MDAVMVEPDWAPSLILQYTYVYTENYKLDASPRKQRKTGRKSYANFFPKTGQYLGS